MLYQQTVEQERRRVKEEEEGYREHRRVMRRGVDEGKTLGLYFYLDKPSNFVIF